MTQDSNRYCGICGELRTAGMTTCPQCGSIFETPYDGPSDNLKGPTRLAPTEVPAKPTQPVWGQVSQPSQPALAPTSPAGQAPAPPGNLTPTAPVPRPGKRSWWVWVLIGQGAVIIVLLTALLIDVAGNHNGPTAPPAATATALAIAQPTATLAPTATATLVPSLPCNVDVGTWTGGTADWKILNGELLNDGTGAFIPPGQFPGPTLLAPCQFDNADYAVEATIQVTSSGGCFGFTVRGSTGSGGWQGYWASAGDGCEAGIAINNGGGVAAACYPGMTKHTCRVEVKGNVIKYLIDGSLLLTWTDNRILTGSQVGLFDSGTQLQVLSFQVTAL